MVIGRLWRVHLNGAFDVDESSYSNTPPDSENPPTPPAVTMRRRRAAWQRTAANVRHVLKAW